MIKLQVVEIQNLASKLNTFRLVQLEIARKHSKNAFDRIVNAPSLLIILIGSIATASTFEVALNTNTLWAAFITLGIQTIAIIFFFIEPKVDHITTRLLLLSYLVFYAIIMFTQTDGSPFPLYWVFTFILFAFVGSGGAESFVWIGAHFSILLGGIARHEVFYEPKLGSSEIRIFIYGYALVTAFAFMLDYAAKLTAKRAYEQNRELEETNARYDVILNSIGDGLIATDARGIVEFANKEACSLLKINRQDIVGQPLTAVVLAKNMDGELIPHKERIITKVLATGKSISLSASSKQKQMFMQGNGEEFLVGMIVSPVKVLGQLRGAIMLFHDISIDDQIDRAKSEFVSLASHQLRTPLNVVSWYVEKMLSERKGPLNDKQKEYLSEVATNNERMIRLVSDLLNVSRVELGRVKLKYERVDLNNLITPLVKEIEPIIEQKNLVLSQEIEIENGIFERSDESVITVIIQNLLSNAIKYTKDHGSITLRVQEKFDGIPLPEHLWDRAIPSHPGVFISVKDSGIGIPKDQQAKIFSKLFRADNVQSLDVSGTGLGLYVTQSFAEALGGSIWFESIEDVGTTFYAFLPYESGK